jgi:hypothetical protein
VTIGLDRGADVFYGLDMVKVGEGICGHARRKLLALGLDVGYDGDPPPGLDR